MTAGEVWDVDALGAYCAEVGVHEFVPTAALIPFTGVVDSPVEPLAVFT